MVCSGQRIATRRNTTYPYISSKKVALFSNQRQKATSIQPTDNGRLIGRPTPNFDERHGMSARERLGSNDYSEFN